MVLIVGNLDMYIKASLIGFILKQRGFSLLELLVVVGIVSVAAALGAPSFAEFIKQDRIVAHANQLHSVFKFARSEAVKRETQVNLRVSENDWEVVEHIGTDDEQVLRTFTQDVDSLSINLSDVTIKVTGELSSTVDVLVTDNDSSTSDYRFCALISGQSWLEENIDQCV